MPLPLPTGYVHADVQSLVFDLSAEIMRLVGEGEEAWRITRMAAHMAKAYIEIVISDLDDGEEQHNDLGQTEVWIDQANERAKP